MSRNPMATKEYDATDRKYHNHMTFSNLGASQQRIKSQIKTTSIMWGCTCTVKDSTTQFSLLQNISNVTWKLLQEREDLSQKLWNERQTLTRSMKLEQMHSDCSNHRLQQPNFERIHIVLLLNLLKRFQPSSTWIPQCMTNCHVHQTQRPFCKILKQLPWNLHNRHSNLEVPQSNLAGCDNCWKKDDSNTSISKIPDDLLKKSTLTSTCRWRTIQATSVRYIKLQ